MKCPAFIEKCPENPDKSTRTDTRARIRNPDKCPSGFPSGFALSVSGFVSAEKVGSELSQPVEIHGIACVLERAGAGYAVSLRASGQRIATAPMRLLAVARAAHNLAPARAFPHPSKELSAAAMQQGA